MLKLMTLSMAFAVLVSIAPSQGSLGPMTFHGLDPLRVGMTPSEAALALKDELTPYDGTAATASCYMVFPSKRPELLLMVEDGAIVRVETESDEFSTLSGVRVGDTEDHARGVYEGRLSVEGHPYDPQGHYLVVESDDGQYAMVLETDGAHVTQIRAGLLPAVRYIEHCL